LAGFDGYTDADPRHIMMQESLDCFRLAHPTTSVVAITRSTYQVAQRSMFAPL